jgi:hypothetical protein
MICNFNTTGNFPVPDLLILLKITVDVETPIMINTKFQIIEGADNKFPIKWIFIYPAITTQHAM